MTKHETQFKNSDVITSIQGQALSFHDQAATHFFGEHYSPVFCDTFNETIELASTEETNFALLAIENSLYGSITEVYDLLRKHDDLTITGEIYLAIHHSLIANEGVDLEDIDKVISHPVALAQCEKTIADLLPNVELVAGTDTAGSAEDLASTGSRNKAAIASEKVAEKLGMTILRSNIEDNPENYTRFVALGKKPLPGIRKNKTSLLITKLSSHENALSPGTLYEALGCFALNKIGLSKIESRPIHGDAWKYLFYIDCMAGEDDDRMIRALDQLDSLGGNWQMLGSYQAGETIG